MDAKAGIPTVVVHLAEVLTTHGITLPMCPDKVFHRTFPAAHAPSCCWELFWNGNPDCRRVTADQWGPIDLRPFQLAVFWNGWLAGLLDPTGGVLAAHPEGANEQTLLESLREDFSHA